MLASVMGSPSRLSEARRELRAYFTASSASRPHSPTRNTSDLCVGAHQRRNKGSNRPETDRVHEGAQHQRRRHMLTTADLKRLAITLICMAGLSGPALLIA
jgi:hypothetical protein